MTAVDTRASRRQPWSIERSVVIAFAIALGAIAASAILAWRSLQAFRDSTGWVSHTHIVLETMEHTFSTLNEAIADVREYVITEDRALLAHRDAVVGRLNASLAELERLTIDNPPQHQRVATLTKMIERRVDLMNELQAVRETRGLEAARTALLYGVAGNLTGRIRAVLNEMESAERILLEEQLQEVEENGQRLMLSAAGLLLVVAMTLAFALLRVWRELQARQTMSEQLGESRRFFQSVFEHIPNMVFIKDARDLRYVGFNPAAERMAQVSRDAVIGKTDFDLFPPEQAKSLTESERKIIEAGGAADIVEEHLRIRKGETRILATRKAVIAADDGTPQYLVGISEDITERVAARKNVEALNKHLRQLNEDLLHKGHALEAANKELESFSYSVSHDLRAPLRAVNSYALMLEEDYAPQLPDEARRFITVIRDGATRMGRLIEDLLAFSRLGRAPLKLVQLDANAAVARATREVLDVLSGPRPELDVRNLPSASADPALMHQVWINLIGNAVKYSSKVPQPRVEIGALQQGSEVVYYVKDNGAGFDMRYVDKLFGVFQRLHGQDEFPGTGVGLAIVHRVVTRHGGRVWAESEIGKGATFSFTLAKGDAA